MTQEAAVHWQKTFDAIDDWVCMIDLDHHIRQTNAAGEKYFGVPAAEMVGRKICSLSHGSDTPSKDCPFPRMLKSGRRESAAMQFADGRWMLVTVDPIFGVDNRITDAVHITRDVTGEVLAHTGREVLVEELKKALAQLKTLKNLLPICSICKRIRDEEGMWNLPEIYIQRRADVDFSHGLCPRCAKHYHHGP